MRRWRNVKIIGTIGPATSDAAAIRALFEAGVDLFRLNFSHGDQAAHAKVLSHIRNLEDEMRCPIGILADLQGPKLRVGEFEHGSVSLNAGDRFAFDLTDNPGNAERVSLPHPEVFAALEPGDALLLDDGRIRLEIETCDSDRAVARVLTGGKLSNHKGLNLPDTVLPLSALTAKDRKDLQFALDLGVDWVALSFVQHPDNLAELRKLVRGRAGVLAKLEKPSGLVHLEGIIELSDAIMVARGDLGVELPPETVPAIQKRIVNACRRAGKPVVVATQMLESMVRAPTPTRAEASDVAAAVYEGADAVMLSAETAVGDYPAEAVAMMDRIITEVENDPTYRPIMDAIHPQPESTAADAITAGARQVAETISAAAIVSFTTSGSTALRAARERPTVPILALTPNLGTARRMALVWGVSSVHTADVQNVEEMVEHACTIARSEDIAAAGERIVITAGMPFGTPGATNLLRIAWVERD